MSGKIDKLTISIEPPKLTPADVAKLRSAAASAADHAVTARRAINMIDRHRQTRLR